MEKRELSEKELREKKLSLAKGTKYLLDFMFYAGILVTVSLPLSLKYIGKYLARCLRRTALYRKMWRALGEWET